MKLAYLTIDDGPSEHMKDKLDYLLSKNIPALLFCRGDFLERFPCDALYAIKKGFVLGNHSYQHHSFSHLDLNRASKEIKITDRIIESLYQKAGLRWPMKIFRFPYGDKGGKNKDRIQEILEKLGYRQPEFHAVNLKDSSLKTDKDILWTYDVEEYRLSSEEVLNKMRTFEESAANEIILTHDHLKTSEMFFKIIDKLSSMNVEFKLPCF